MTGRGLNFIRRNWYAHVLHWVGYYKFLYIANAIATLLVFLDKNVTPYKDVVGLFGAFGCHYDYQEWQQYCVLISRGNVIEIISIAPLQVSTLRGLFYYVNIKMSLWANNGQYVNTTEIEKAYMYMYMYVYPDYGSDEQCSLR